MNKPRFKLFLTALLVSASASAHDLAFDNDPQAARLSIGVKTVNTASGVRVDRVFRDGLGREAHLRGWNVSGAAKHVETGFKPFRSTADAADTFDTMGEATGANVVRLLFAWEGVNPAAGQINTAYLQQMVAQMREAIRNRMYVLVDFHQDLYSRHFFNTGSWHTGNGAPRYVIRNGNIGKEYCGIICASWAQHQQTDAPMRQSMNDFWTNTTVNGVAVQDAYLWQLGQTLAYLKSQLTAAEFSYVIGLDPWNEPFDGGMNGLSAKDWENRYLWSFHQRVRTVMDNNGWSDKPSFAELLVYWNSKVPIVAQATGGFNLTPAPGARYVFNAHFYDQERLGTSTAAVNNGTYFKNLQEVRDVSRYSGSAPFLSEFGFPLDGSGGRDPNRVMNAVHQAMEAGDAGQATKSRYLDPYTPLISGTQWHWDTYWNRHAEYKNFSNTLQTATDAWNGENFSAIGLVNGALGYNLKPEVVQRAYPRRVQGDIISFTDSNRAGDKGGNDMAWASLRPQGSGREYLRNNRFALLVWQGRRSEAPTELYLPGLLDPAGLTVVTEKQIRTLSQTDSGLTQLANEAVLLADNARRNPGASGRRLLVWDDADSDESADSWHYALVFRRNSGDSWTSVQLQQLQADLNRAVVQQKLSPVWLTGTMTNSGYPADNPL